MSYNYPLLLPKRIRGLKYYHDETMAKSRLSAEVQRKLFHSLMVFVAIVNWLGGPTLSIGFAGICLAVFISFDIVRVRVYGYFPFRRITDRVMRPTERTRIGAYVFFAVGTLFTLLIPFILGNLLLLYFGLLSYWLLNGWLAVAAVIVAALGDGVAAITGMLFGRHKLRGNLTIEGTIGGFVGGLFAFLPLWYFLGMPLLFGVIAAIMLMVVDIAYLPLDDNLVNPIAIGGALTLIEVISVALGWVVW